METGATGRGVRRKRRSAEGRVSSGAQEALTSGIRTATDPSWARLRCFGSCCTRLFTTIDLSEVYVITTKRNKRNSRPIPAKSTQEARGVKMKFPFPRTRLADNEKNKRPSTPEIPVALTLPLRMDLERPN
jgi:hypothetical protein